MRLNFINRRQFDRYDGHGHTGAYKDVDGDWVGYTTPKGKAAIMDGLVQILRERHEAISLLKRIYDGYGRSMRNDPIPDSTCPTCNGFLYVCRDGVPDVDCPSCQGTGQNFVTGIDSDKFAEFIEHSIMFADTPFLRLIGELGNGPENITGAMDEYTCPNCGIKHNAKDCNGYCTASCMQEHEI